MPKKGYRFGKKKRNSKLRGVHSKKAEELMDVGQYKLLEDVEVNLPSAADQVVNSQQESDDTDTSGQAMLDMEMEVEER